MRNETTTRTTIRNLKGHNCEPVLHPDPILAREDISITFLERFLEKIEFTETCILWKGTIHGKLLKGKRKGGNISAKRASWLIYNGEIPDGFNIMSACPFCNSQCIHPNHIGFASRNGVRLDSIEHHPLSSAQLERLEVLCKQAGESKDEILRRLTATYKTPDWMLALGFSETFATRFWSKVEKTNSCWIWTGGKSDDEHGTIGKGRGKTSNIIGAHRASWMLHNGPIPRGKHILHKCPGRHNPSCVNPDHLETGNQSQNSQDAADQQRRLGKKYWNAKLTYADIENIKFVFLSGGITKAELARKFGISATHVSYLVRPRVNRKFFYFSCCDVGDFNTHIAIISNIAKQLVT